MSTTHPSSPATGAASPSPGQLGTLAKAAKRYDTSTRTIRRYIASGDLTGYKVGPRLVRVDMDELESLIQRIPTAASIEAGGNDVST